MDDSTNHYVVVSIQKIQQALILAGGEGSRLRPITEKIPKSMIEVKGKPFLEHQLELLAKNGVKEVVLCVGYLWEQIKDYFGNHYMSLLDTKIALRYSVESRFLGTGGAVKNAEKFIKEFFFILYGDTYLPIDFQTMGELIFKKDVAGVVSVYSNSDKITNNNIITDNDGFIIKYDKIQEISEMNGVEAGVSLFNKKILALLPRVEEIAPDQKVSLEMEIYPKLIIQHQLFGYRTDTRFYDMGTFERLKTISEVLG